MSDKPLKPDKDGNYAITQEYADRQHDACLRVQDSVVGMVHQSIWDRHKTYAKRAMEIANKMHPGNMTPKFYLWQAKARQLLYKLCLPENGFFWEKPPNILPYSRSTKEYHLWRIDCLERDNWQCQHCDSTNKLNIHHIGSYKTHPKLRTEVDNGITLCRKCHTKEHRRVRSGV